VASGNVSEELNDVQALRGIILREVNAAKRTLLHVVLSNGGELRVRRDEDEADRHLLSEVYDHERDQMVARAVPRG
jgi:hypothetical protein